MLGKNTRHGIVYQYLEGLGSQYMWWTRLGSGLTDLWGRRPKDVLLVARGPFIDY